MRYKRYDIDLNRISEYNDLPDLVSVHSDNLEDHEFNKKETLPDGVVLYRVSPGPFNQTVLLHIPEYHPVFNFGLGVATCFSCYYVNAATRDIKRLGDLRNLLFRHIVQPFFNTIPKKYTMSWPRE